MKVNTIKYLILFLFVSATIGCNRTPEPCGAVDRVMYFRKSFTIGNESPVISDVSFLDQQGNRHTQALEGIWKEGDNTCPVRQ